MSSPQLNSPQLSSVCSSTTRPRQRRITQACDFCHRRGVKCREPITNPADGQRSSCLTCLEYGETCTRTRRPKRRGTKPRGPPTAEAGSSRSVHEPNPWRASHGTPFETINVSVIDGDITQSRLANRKVITALLDVYLDTIHPTFPFFCEREIWVRWRDGSFPSGLQDYMSLICMCALSAQHVGNGALFSDDAPSSESGSLAHSYLEEANRLVPVDFDSPSVDVIRCYGFLALLGVQNGNTSMAHKYLGLYHGICAQYNLHDESKWPRDITTCGTEVRRRIWWAMYRLEVHTACVMGSLIRCSERQSNVGYPSGTHHPPFIPGRDGQYEDWFSGWNATTDLYRVLEHAVSEFRVKRRPRPSILQDNKDSAEASAVTTEVVMGRLSRIQEELMPQFEAASSRSSDSGRNRCGFQASNMLCTVHLARMILSITDEASLASVFQTARYMMEKMNDIPREYIRAVGSPLLQQLAGVGHMLVGVARKHELCHEDYHELRAVLMSMIQFLAQFDKHYSKIARSAQQRLSDQVADLDNQLSSMALVPENLVRNESLSMANESEGHITWFDLADDGDMSNFGDGVLSGNLLSAFIGQYFSTE